MEDSMLRKLWIALVIVIVSFPLSAATSDLINTYEGSGDDYIRIEKTMEEIPAAVLISGNSAGRHFSITSNAASGDYIDLLVNTTEKYSGTVPIDLGTPEKAKYLEINAVGTWTIHVYPIPAIPKLTSTDVVSDTGDALLWIEGDGNVLSINGNSSERHFAITAYDKYGNYNGLLVNTTDRYSGRVRLPKDSLILQVSAVGNWSIGLQ